MNIVPLQDLRKRTKSFALRIIKMFCALPKSPVAQVLGKQVLKSGTSVGAHYHEAYRSRSKAEFISKIGGGLQELEEIAYWLELLVDSGIISNKRLVNLQNETMELTAILSSIAIKAKKRK